MSLFHGMTLTMFAVGGSLAAIALPLESGILFVCGSVLMFGAVFAESVYPDQSHPGRRIRRRR